MYNNYNPYYNQPRFQQPQPMQPQQMMEPSFQKQPSLLGKQVDSLDVVKATDVPFDGSVSYFPLTDGSAIVTKQLQMDGTSKIVIFKPSVEQQKEPVQYLTNSDLEDIREELEELHRELRDLKKKKGE